MVDAEQIREVEIGVKDLKIGEKYFLYKTYNRDSGGIDMYWERLNETEHKYWMDFQKNAKDKNLISCNTPVTLTNYGSKCPRCSKTMREVVRYTSSDGFFGLENDRFVCEDVNCGISRVCEFAGYGNV